MDERAPEATELVYVPEPSWQPAIFALGLALVLAGIFVWFPYGVVGAVLALLAGARMLGGSFAWAERLPRRQRPSTAVIPPVPPRKPPARA
jgi:hypothetical protein